jgi:uncharacterized membrane protein YvlD (DUF360 family)
VNSPGEGRLVRGGRVVARLLAVWGVAAAALVLLDRWLAGFDMPQWWQPTVVALLFGVLSAVLWPLILRVAAPLALFTLGIGSFLLLGAGMLVLSFAVPGVTITDFGTAVTVVLWLSAVGALASSLIGLDEDELFFRRAARRARGGAGGADDEPPGVVFLQIDGLGHEVARRAVRDGNMPTFAAWLAAGSHRLTHWNTDWSSQTGAGVCGILHGNNAGILGYRYYEKDRDHVVVCGNPEDAAHLERTHSDGRGLLSVDGAGHGNLFTGDAPHVSLTMSALPLLSGAQRRRGRARDPVAAGYVAYFANPANALRTGVGYLVDVAREISAATRQRRAGVVPRMDRGGFYPFLRAATTVIARDIVVSAVLEDMLAGRSCVYVDLLGYDEVAHHSGIERFDTLSVLRAIDRQIGRLHRAAQLAPRRYHLVCLSDHGQTQGLPFAQRFGETIEELVGRLCGASPARCREIHEERGEQQRKATRRSAEGWQVGAVLHEASGSGGPIARRLRARVQQPADVEEEPAHPVTDAGAVNRVAPGVVVVLSGHTAMISFTEHPGRVELETIERGYPDLLPALVDHDGVGFVLVRSAELGPIVYGRDGALRLADGTLTGEDPLAGYGPHAADLIRRFDAFPNCPDVVVNSRYDPETDDATPFEPHVGTHGGLGGPQSRGFLMFPAELPAPEPEIVGAEALHRVLRGWLTHLGHPEPAPPDAARDPLADPAARAG